MSFTRAWPGVVGTDAPAVSLGIADAKLAGAVGSFLKRARDCASCGNSALVDGIHIFNHNIDAAGFNVAQIFG